MNSKNIERYLDNFDDAHNVLADYQQFKGHIEALVAAGDLAEARACVSISQGRGLSYKKIKASPVETVCWVEESCLYFNGSEESAFEPYVLSIEGDEGMLENPDIWSIYYDLVEGYNDGSILEPDEDEDGEDIPEAVVRNKNLMKRIYNFFNQCVAHSYLLDPVKGRETKRFAI